MDYRRIEDNVLRIASAPLEVIEQEYGLSGIDYVIELALNRRRSIMLKLQVEREKYLCLQAEVIQSD